MNTMKLFAAVALTVLLSSPGAFSQSVSPSSQPKASPARKKPKVWTNDNIDSVLTPADDYEIEQAKEKQARESTQPAAQQNSNISPLLPKPQNVKQADSLIAQKKQLLASQQHYLTRVQKMLANPGNSQLDRTRLAWRLKSHTISERQTQADLTQLQADRQALVKKAADSSKKEPSAENSDSDQP